MKKLLDERSKAVHEVTRLRDEVQKVAWERDTARQGAALVEADYKGLLEAYKRQSGENQMYQRQVEKFASQVDNKELFLGSQHSDSDIQGMFHALFTQVRSWSSGFSSKHQVVRQMLKDHQRLEFVMSQIAPGGAGSKLLNKPSTRRVAVQGIVGYWLTECIFRRLGDLRLPSASPVLDQWSQGNADAIDKIEGVLSRGQ